MAYVSLAGEKQVVRVHGLTVESPVAQNLYSVLLPATVNIDATFTIVLQTLFKKVSVLLHNPKWTINHNGHYKLYWISKCDC